METPVPLFKSHYSLGKSILTLENDLTVHNDAPVSCLSLCKDSDFSHLVLVDDNMSGFLQAYQNAKENGLQLVFGLRMTICDDMSDKSEDSRKTNNKIVIFIKNSDGYGSLIKIFSHAARKGFYYEPRTDYASLKKFWDDKSLRLVVPFYDSFIHKNLLENALCVPKLSFTEVEFFVEDNDLPFNGLITTSINKVTKDGSKNKVTKSKSIYYNKKEDFKAYLTFRCISNRTTLDKPNLDHMTSNEFSFESWKEAAHA